MSFSADIKNELSRIKNGKKCCAFAELYGIILFASVLSVSEIKILTSCIALERKINRLCDECGFFHVPWNLKGSNGHYSISLTETEWVAKLLNSFDFDISGSPVVHFKAWNLENDCCRNSFLRGIFLSGGYVADPKNACCLEFTSPRMTLVSEIKAFLCELGLVPNESRRREEYVLYYKGGDKVEEVLIRMGAGSGALKIIEERTLRETRNRINRKVNCEASNIMKAAESAAAEAEAAERIRKAGKFETLPEQLREAVMLREQYPFATLNELAGKCNPPVSKSGFNHRIKKIISIAAELNQIGVSNDNVSHNEGES